MPTLADYKNLPIFKPFDMSELPVCRFSDLAKVVVELDSICPTTAAVEFYAYNHMVHIIEQHHHTDVDLGEYDEILSKYTKLVSDLGLRMLTYMTCICVRESRHMHILNLDYTKLESAKIHKQVVKKSGFDSVLSFIVATTTGSELGHIRFGEFMKFLQIVFYEHKWGSSFGGKAWGKITDQVQKYFTGETSLEILLDTSFTLAHNTGPIFNKGFLFKNNQSHLTEVLDVQRSGQMLEYVVCGNYKGTSYDKKVINRVREDIEVVAQLQDIDNVVDWKQVMKLGSVGSYNHYIPAEPIKKDIPKNMDFVPAGTATWSNKPIPDIIKNVDDKAEYIKIHPLLTVKNVGEEVKKKRKENKFATAYGGIPDSKIKSFNDIEEALSLGA